MHRPVFVTDCLSLSRPLGFGRGREMPWPGTASSTRFPPYAIWRSRGARTCPHCFPVASHKYDPATFEIGRQAEVVARRLEIGIYDAQRSSLSFRLRHREGADLAVEALQRWLRLGGQPSVLLQVAKSFPRALPSLRQTLEILL